MNRSERSHGWRRGIATVCLSGTLEDKLQAAAHAGFDGIEIFEPDLIGSAMSPAQVRTEATRLGLSIDLFQPFRDAEGVPPDRWPATLRRARHKFGVMADLGTETILVCSSVAPDTIDDDDLAAAQLRELAELAATHGMRIAYEALAWGRHVSTWEHSWRIVSQADHPALGLCLDSFHILSRTADAVGIDQLPGNRIFFVQLADAPRLAMDVLQWSRHHRVFPGQGSFDLVDFTGALLRTGYAGPLSLEVFNDLFRQSDPKRSALDAMRSLVDLEDRVARDTAQGSASIRCAAVTDPPRLRGHAFAELTVDGLSGPEVADALHGLGFTHTGQHRSKPVQLWEQAGARVVLNAAVVHPEHAIGTAGVSAIALSSTDPAASATRAAAMLAVAVPHRRGPAEADLHSVLAPDGTEVVFCPTADVAGADWRNDFLRTGVSDECGAGLTGIDHIALAQPFDNFHEAGLFYRSVLGLPRAEPGELAAPFGLIRTLAEADDTSGIRIALSSTLLRRGNWAPGVQDPQHVAFTTRDILTTADALARNGAPLLRIAHNYYDDLAARTDLTQPDIDRYEQHGILYDADDSGEFLHLYTPILGGRLFFEVVQRLHGYTGYGAVNAAVRMAAQRHARLRVNAEVPATSAVGALR